MKRIIALLLAVIMCASVLVGCGIFKRKGGQGHDEPLFKSMSQEGQLRALAYYNGEAVVSASWDEIEAAPLEAKDRYHIPSSATVKAVWDYTRLSVRVDVTDADVCASDSVELYLDTYWDKSSTYQPDDYHVKVTSAAELECIAGDKNNVDFEVAPIYEEDKITGYTVIIHITFDEAPISESVMGFDVRYTDSDSTGAIKGVANLFDRTDSVNDDPSSFGEIILCSGFESTEFSLTRVEKLIERLESEDLTVYGGYESVNAKIRELKVLLEKSNVTAKEVNQAMSDAHKAYEKLVDASDFPEIKDIKQSAEYPDPFVMLDGTKMKNIADWEARRKEISDMYQYYMYGVWRDGSDEVVTYDYHNGTLTVYVERISTGAKTQFTATVLLPDSSVKAPSKAGYPVVVGMHAGISEDVANKNGFATITIDWFSGGIASDDTRHTGAFYDLYPYGETWQEQTGVLMAWSWGCSKVLDALEAGLGKELNIDGANSIVTGVSRWGKAATVCGAFEPRFKMAAPSCSGAGGLALYRYVSKGRTYNFSSKGASAAYTYGDNEPLGSLQSPGEMGWFNNNFKQFKNANHLPLDQYMLASLIADKDRYLFIIGSCIYEDWVNAPAMWYTYLASKQIYDYLGVGDNIKVNIHKEGHAVIAEDMQYMTEFFKEKVYGIKPESDLSVLDSSVFALEENVDHAMDDFTADWLINFMLD